MTTRCDYKGLEGQRHKCRGKAELLRLGLTLQEAEQQVNGFESLVAGLAAGHAHLPFPDVSQWQVTEHLVFCQHLLKYLKT